MLSSTVILSIKVTTSTSKDIMSEVENYLSQKKIVKPLTIFTPNPELVVYARENPWFRDLLNSGDINLPDGAGIIFASRILRTQNSELNDQKVRRISGVDFMLDLVKLAAGKHWKVAFIGGWKGAAELALNKLKQRYPGFEGWTEEPDVRLMIKDLRLKNLNKLPIHQSLIINHKSSPATEEYFNQLTKRIQDSGVRLIFVGLGAPKQELFIECIKYLELNSIKYQVSSVMENVKVTRDTPLLLMTVGGAFDMISGKTPRAPKFVRQLNLEWFWRLILEPKRIFRQLKLIKFIFLVIKTKFGI